MYAFFSKGMTVGHVLTRRILREITSVPGILLDFVFAIFWIPDYTSYWQEGSSAIEYADGTRHTGIMRGFFGWIGEALGFVIGAPVGALIGTLLFFPDLFYRGIHLLHEKIAASLNRFAAFIGNTSFFEQLNVYEHPTSYMQKGWNLGTAILGMTLSAIPFTLTKALEFVFPFLNVSHPINVFFAATGGFLGWVSAALFFPLIYTEHKLIEAIDLFRARISKGVALVYAKSGQIPVGPENMQEECITYQAIHSDEFREQVKRYSRSSWTELVFGPLRGNAAQPPVQDQLVDPFSLEPLGANGIPTIIDIHGHSFNDDRATGKPGIRFWVSQHHSCPLNQLPLHENELIPNRAFDELCTHRN